MLGVLEGGIDGRVTRMARGTQRLGAPGVTAGDVIGPEAETGRHHHTHVAVAASPPTLTLPTRRRAAM